ncbi:MAG TPA: helix-turn-helix domain-containing protein [Anaeromyxobacter sp.]
MRPRKRGAPGPASGRRRSSCPVACTLDLVGDRWSLVLVRDLLLRGPRRYGDLLAGPEGIPTNILADRLKRLAAAGLVEARAYSDRPPRREYALTERGRALGPVLRAMAVWGLRHVPGTQPPPGLPLS